MTRASLALTGACVFVPGRIPDPRDLHPCPSWASPPEPEKQPRGRSRQGPLWATEGRADPRLSSVTTPLKLA